MLYCLLDLFICYWSKKKIILLKRQCSKKYLSLSETSFSHLQEHLLI